MCEAATGGGLATRAFHPANTDGGLGEIRRKFKLPVTVSKFAMLTSGALACFEEGAEFGFRGLELTLSRKAVCKAHSLAFVCEQMQGKVTAM